jgi:hypothetical protein
MPTWLLNINNVKWIGIGLLVAGNVIFFGMYKHESDAFTEYKAKEQVVVQTTQVAQKQVTKESSNVYKANLATINGYYSNGLRFDSTNTFSEATRGINGIPTYPVFVKQCAQTTLQLVSLQQWIKDESNATEEISK